MSSPADWVVVAGIGLSVASFLVFIGESIAAHNTKAVAEAKALADQAAKAAQAAANPAPTPPGFAPVPKPTLPEFTELLKGMADLVGSLAKAGPALTSIVASVLFLLVAAVGAGAFQGATKEKTETAAPADNKGGDNKGGDKKVVPPADDKKDQPAPKPVPLAPAP